MNLTIYELLLVLGGVIISTLGGASVFFHFAVLRPWRQIVSGLEDQVQDYHRLTVSMAMATDSYTRNRTAFEVARGHSGTQLSHTESWGPTPPADKRPGTDVEIPKGFTARANVRGVSAQSAQSA